MGGQGSGRKPVVPPCGTTAGYRRHWKRKESCGLCKAAWNDYVISRRKPKTNRKKGVKNLTIGQKNRELVRNEKLLRGSCVDCGLVIDERTIVCIDFDHRDPQDKSFTISYLMDKAHPSDMMAEMAKCDAVCRNCHALRTHAGKHWLNRRECSEPQMSLFDD
jgi:hypothetical protein